MDSKKKLSFDTYGKTVKSLKDKILKKDEEINQSFKVLNSIISEYVSIASEYLERND